MLGFSGALYMICPSAAPWSSTVLRDTPREGFVTLLSPKISTRAEEARSGMHRGT